MSCSSQTNLYCVMMYGFFQTDHFYVIMYCTVHEDAAVERSYAREQKLSYTRQSLIHIGMTQQQQQMQIFQHTHQIPAEIIRAPGSLWITIADSRQWRRQEENKQKRGCRVAPLYGLGETLTDYPFPALHR